MGRGKLLWRLKESYLLWRWQHLLRLAEHYRAEEAEAKATYDAHTKG